ncbi:integrin beta-1-like [Eucyclogobius newberryi]|uniref:integrin beta-1-like n=1 Tax=Eucyclogobius newberryi TaxID=166745 RepID=UPI003B58ECEA
MDVRLLYLCVLGSLLCPSQGKNQSCLTSASTCDECIQSGPECGWCMDPLTKTRCNTMKRLQRAGCTRSQVYNPRGELTIKRNEPADGRLILLQPQELSVNLRPGVSLDFTLRITTTRHQLINELMLETTSEPEGVNITFKKVSTANSLVFVVNVKADKCSSNNDSNQSQNQTGPWSVDIKPSGLPQSAKLKINLECQCDCLNKQEPDSPECNTHGTLVCGVCLCQKPYSGSTCQTGIDSMDSMSDAFCRTRPNAPVCSGKGFCEEGFCVCEKPHDPNEIYSGQFCECNNFDCPYNNGRHCGGHGTCECGQCNCEEGWAGDDCSCTMDAAPCMAENQMICSGRGLCNCGRCRCDPPYNGPTCEFCPTCQNRCQEHASCAECRVFGAERCEAECRDYSVTIVDTKENVPTPLCKMISQKDSCLFYFSYSSSSSAGRLTVAKTKECPRATFT